MLQRNRDTKTRIAMRVVRGAIQRIDDPLPLTLFAAHQGRLARFLRQNPVLWIIRTDSLDDQVFSSDIGFGDEVDVAFICDLRGPETLDQQVSCVTSNLSGEVKHLCYPSLREY